ncbi:unnamed protein product [Sphagnum jensenii]|uniref:Glyoxal oxidase n=1 Tax=Sphagnum jensenii TaxID=128206 RepID=A0ABP1B5Z7_9BRYO
MGCSPHVSLMLIILAFTLVNQALVCLGQPGTWQLLLENAGIASMHTAVTHYGTVVFLDRTDIGASQINLPNGECRNDPNDAVLTHDCTAHSVEFTPGPNTVRPLTIQTDTWCSSGAFRADGTLVQTGGDADGAQMIRYFAPCAPGGTCDWVEDAQTHLQVRRWYASNQLLADGTVLIVGGQGVFSYEFVPPQQSDAQVSLPFLQATLKAPGDEDNLYPFVHMLPNGNLFIFARRDSILLDVSSGAVLQNYPTMPGTEARNYPATGSSVMLPLDSANGFTTATILVCGGGNENAFSNPQAQLPASSTCGLLEATATNPQWTMLNMPFQRTMGDMLLLPDGRTLLINGAQSGSAGWGLASNPTLNPVAFNPVDSSFEVQAATTIPRVYHSTAVLLPDTRVLVAGSNTHEFYTFTQPFPTELRVEAFSPQYIDDSFNSQRPTVMVAPAAVGYGQNFTLTVAVPAPQGAFQLRLSNAPYTTHSFAQGQRQLVLPIYEVVITGPNQYTIFSSGPPNTNLAPSAYYMLFPVQNGIPGTATWVQIS